MAIDDTRKKDLLKNKGSVKRTGFHGVRPQEKANNSRNDAATKDGNRLFCLKLELAITIDLGEHFVKATYIYFLEGDGPLVLSCYEKLSAIVQVCQALLFQNVRVISAAVAEQDPHQNAAALERSAETCVDPAIHWFPEKIQCISS